LPLRCIHPESIHRIEPLVHSDKNHRLSPELHITHLAEILTAKIHSFYRQNRGDTFILTLPKSQKNQDIKVLNFLKSEHIPIRIDANRVAFDKLSGDQLVGQRIFQPLLNDPFERTSAEYGIISLVN